MNSIDKLPIIFKEHLQLQKIGVNHSSITFNSLTIQSDRYICIRDVKDGKNQVVIVDLSDLTNIMRRPITADSAIMHPFKNVIALKAATTLQVFNLDTKTKLKSMVFSSPINYWCFINESIIAMVTERSVYHWNINDNSSEPTKMFDLNENLLNTQIISYKTNQKLNWMALTGICAKEGRVAGNMQLHNVEKRASQPIDAFCHCFARVNLGSMTDTQIFAFANKIEDELKLHIVEIDHQEGAVRYDKVSKTLNIPEEAANDFPVGMTISSTYGIVYIITKFGFIYLMDIMKGEFIYTERISGDTVFVVTQYNEDKGILAINRKGQVLSVCIDTDNIINYIVNQVNNVDLALRIASHSDLKGAEELYVRKFENDFNNNNYQEAAKTAALSPNGILRTRETIEKFKSVASDKTNGGSNAILQYFILLLERGSLNQFESVELAKPVMQQGKKHLIENWLKENKLYCSEELGDVVRLYDPNPALLIYVRGNVTRKAVALFAELGYYNKIIPYCVKTNYSPDYIEILESILRTNPQNATEFASQLITSNVDGPLVDIEQLMDMFERFNQIDKITSILLDVLKDNKPEHAHLQTRLLEMTLNSAPQVADAILANRMFEYYDNSVVAHLCERNGLSQRALEHYTQPEDIQRVLLNSNGINAQWLVDYFEQLEANVALACLKEMLNSDYESNLKICVQIFSRYSEKLGPPNIISILESIESYEGLYYYIGSIISSNKDPEVHYKYLVAAASFDQSKEVERLCRESQYLNGEQAKNFLKKANLPDLLPLIIICDRFDYVHELCVYLYQNDKLKYVEVYLYRVNSKRTPEIIGALLDVGCGESVIRNILLSVGSSFSAQELVDECTRRNRLNVIRPWIEKRLDSGATEDKPLHNAMAIIKIDTNDNAEMFLKTNQLYDSKYVGDYCAGKDPHLSYIAYQKDDCDDEILALTNQNSMFKQQALYLIRKKDLNLWLKVLSSENEFRSQVIEHIIGSNIGGSEDPEEVTIAVKAFVSSELPLELIELLDNIVLKESVFSTNKTLQNLLILTAIKVKKEKVQYYIDRLDRFDAVEIANVAKNEGLSEEALRIYMKRSMNTDAIQVMLNEMDDINKAENYSHQIEDPECWRILAQAYLKRGESSKCIEFYIRANHANDYIGVIELCEKNNKTEELINYLNMARTKISDPIIDNQLLICICKLGKLNDLETLLNNQQTVANLKQVGDKCCELQLYECAKLIYTRISDYNSLAPVCVQLGEYMNAVDCARKANTTYVWKVVNEACLFKREFRLAKICGLNLIVHPEELSNLISIYLKNGYIDQLCELLENGIDMQQAHKGIYTHLCIIYINHKPQKVMEYIRSYSNRLNVPRLIQECSEFNLYKELVCLKIINEEYDSSLTTMMSHPGISFQHDLYMQCLSKASNSEIIYKSTLFYFEYYPTLLNEMLISIKSRIDNLRLIETFQKSPSHARNLGFIRRYLFEAQGMNNKYINKACHELLIENNEHEFLNNNIDEFNNFDHVSLADILAKHENIHFRMIAIKLYNKTSRFEQSIGLAIKDHLHEKAIQTCKESNSSKIALELFVYFIENDGLKENICALLYVCSHLLKPAVVLEKCWKNGLINHAMPYFIHTMQVYEDRIKNLETKESERSYRESTSKQGNNNPAKRGQGVIQKPLMISENVPLTPKNMTSSNGPSRSNNNASNNGYGTHSAPRMFSFEE